MNVHSVCKVVKLLNLNPTLPPVEQHVYNF